MVPWWSHWSAGLNVKVGKVVEVEEVAAGGRLKGDALGPNI